LNNNMAFNREAAKQAGYTDEEIDSYLKSKSDESLGRYLKPQIIPFVQNVLNIPQAVKQAVKETKQKGPLAAPSPELRQLAGGTMTDTGNRFLNSLLDALKVTQTSTRAGAEVGSAATLVRALIPYLTYGGINRLAEQRSSQGPDVGTGKDILNTLTENLSTGEKMGNIPSEVQPTILDMLKNRMAGGFNALQNYSTGDLYQTAKNIGTGEPGGYDWSQPAGQIRSALTDLVKLNAPDTRFPYWAATQLSKLPGILRNPVAWPFEGYVASKIPKVAKGLLGF
jgi:hypothetical protein